MPLILNIDTALEKASVCLAENGNSLCFSSTGEQKDVAAWLHPAIRDLFSQSGKEMKELAAIAVSNGPGSYTGLRIGLSAAKGFCYALGFPLITIPTPEVLALAVKEEAEDLIVPLIDARRNEVFTAVYDRFMRVKNSTYTLILEPRSFASLLEEHKIIFTGTAVEKARNFIQHPRAQFSEVLGDAKQLAVISEQRWVQNEFADLAYTEPFYTKEFYSGTGK